MRPIIVFNEYNEPEEVLEQFAELWAKKHDVSASEALKAQEVGSEITARFTLRWSETSAMIDARYTIDCEGRTYNITGRREVGRKHWIEIDAVARAETNEAFEVASP